MVESVPVTYDLYIAVKFNPTSFVGLISFIKGLRSVDTTRYRFVMGWFICAAAHVLFFPTLFGASTGYYSPSKAVYQVEGSSTYIEAPHYMAFFEKLANSCFKIENGPLIGLPEHFILQPREVSLSTTNWRYNKSIEYGKTKPYRFVTGPAPNDTSLWMNLTNCTFIVFYTIRLFH